MQECHAADGPLGENMFFLKKLITSLILPPGIFIAVFVSLGLYQSIRRRKMGYIILLSGLLLYALSIAPTKDALLLPLENAFPFSPSVKGDVIVVLGGDINEDASRLKARGFSSRDGFSRLVCAYQLWKRLRVKILYTGNLGSKVAVEFLTMLGIPRGDVIIDNQARDTFGNSLRAKEILKARGFKAPILVTSAFHMKRAVYAFRNRKNRG
jgi:uncharacterized SAM-binding protein YcdF (DUF218 family)